MAETLTEFFEAKVAGKLAAAPDLAEKVGAVYQFKIGGEGGGDWVVDLVKSEVRAGEAEAPDCTISMNGGDFISMVSGKLRPEMAFMMGKLKVTGDRMLAMKLSEILK